MIRRTFLVAGSSSFTTLLAGCSVTERVPKSDSNRELQLLMANVAKSSTGWELFISVYNSDNTFKETYFHRVRLLAFTKAGDLVCEKPIGDVLNQVGVELSCSEFPHFITADARESPCDEKIDLMLLESEGKDDEGEYVWKAKYRGCDGDLLPITS